MVSSSSVDDLSCEILLYTKKRRGVMGACLSQSETNNSIRKRKPAEVELQDQFIRIELSPYSNLFELIKDLISLLKPVLGDLRASTIITHIQFKV